jgi:hypothetical protein
MNWMTKRVGSGWWLGLAATALGAILLSQAARADDTGQPAAGAARLSSVDGQVRISMGGQVIADPAIVNAPLFPGTQVETGDDGKAEIQFEDGSVARLSPDSSLTLTSLGGQGGAEVILASGLGYFELQGGAQGGPMRVRFSGAVATATGFTVMRVKLDNQPGELAVFSGNAHLESGNSLAVDVHGGESLALNGTASGRYNLAETIEPDSWDAWNSDRDQALNNQATEQTTASSSFVNSNNPNPAWNDLDANGNWYNVPGQGYVWSPYEAANAGWDPYGNGNWMWTPGYGYIYASGYPWGYMPYQCGLWNYYDGFGWGWAPGMGMGMGMGTGMGGCHPWWGRGGYGINIGRTPAGYRPITRPILRGGGGRGEPPRIIPVSRHPFENGGGLPPRSRNTPAQIGGYTVQPLRPMPSHQKYESSPSGFVYRPAQGYQGTRTVGEASGAPQSGNSGRPGYVQPSAPVYAPMRTYTPPTQNNASPSGNNPSQTPGLPPGGRVGKPPQPGPGAYTGGGSYVRPSGGGGAYNGGASASRPSGGGGNPPSGGGSYSRPSGGGGNSSGGGGSTSRPSGGGGGGNSSGGGSHTGAGPH